MADTYNVIVKLRLGLLMKACKLSIRSVYLSKLKAIEGNLHVSS